MASTLLARQVGDAARVDRGVQRAEQAQRIDVAVERAVAAADHLGPDIRQHPGDLGMVQDLGLVVDDTRLVVQALQRIGARLELPLRQSEMETAGPLEADIEPGLLLQGLGKARPRVGGAQRPAGTGCQPQPLALHPDQREVAAPSPHRAVALVEHDDPAALARQSPGGGDAHQTAADDRDIVFAIGHRRSFRPAAVPVRRRPGRAPPASNTYARTRTHRRQTRRAKNVSDKQAFNRRTCVTSSGGSKNKLRKTERWLSPTVGWKTTIAASSME